MAAVGQRSRGRTVLQDAVGEQRDHLPVDAAAFQLVFPAVGLGIARLGGVVAGFLGLQDAEHLAGRLLADGAAGNDRALGAEEFQRVLRGGVRDIEIVINDTVGAIAEADQDGRGVFDGRGVCVDEQVGKAGHLDDRRAENPFQEVEAMGAHVQQRATVAEGDVLPPGAGNGRIPAGQLRAAHHHSAQRAGLHQFARLLVIDVLPHAPGEHELHAGLRAGGFHLVHLRHGDGDGFFAQDMLSRPGGLHGLAAMGVGGRGDIHGLHVLGEQFRLGGAGVRHAELGGDFPGARRVGVHHGDQLRVSGQFFEFGDGAPGRNAAATDHSPFNFVAHIVRFAPGRVELFIGFRNAAGRVAGVRGLAPAAPGIPGPAIHKPRSRRCICRSE